MPEERKRQTFKTREDKEKETAPQKPGAAAKPAQDLKPEAEEK